MKLTVNTFLSISTLILSLTGEAQPTSDIVTAVNSQIDLCVVAKDIDCMARLYAKDFIFTHGTGLVEGKDSWLKTVMDPSLVYVSRVHDSTHVEMHKDVAIVTGRLDVTRERDQQSLSYGLWYIRVFVKKGRRWQLISHRTTREWHE